MAYRLEENHGYGDGVHADLTANSATVVNKYARVIFISGKTIKVDNITNTGTSSFTSVGREIMIHVAGVKDSSLKTCNKRGNFILCKIKSYNDSDGIITLTKGLSSVLGGYSLDQLFVQAITVPHYKTVTINSGKTITCPQFDYTTGVGGVVAFKCSKELIFNGGSIDLGDKGMPDNTNWAYGQVKFETGHEVTHNYEYWENYRTTKHLTINYPDGACFIAAKKMTCHTDSRIGRAKTSSFDLPGVARDRTGTSESYCGGSSIHLVAETIEDWTPQIIAKYPWPPTNRTNFRGRQRCYIATETTLPCDEGLYALDRISDPERMSRALNVKNFGNGELGTGKNVVKQLNSYAQVTGIGAKGIGFSIGQIDENGVAKFKVGSLVMIHVTSKGSNFENTGKFWVTTLTKVIPGEFNVADAYPKLTHGATSGNYVQIIAIPQYQNFTSTKINLEAPVFKKSLGIGGIVAIACSDTCNLSGGGGLKVKNANENIGNSDIGAPAYGAGGLQYLSNASLAERLPIGEGHGSIFILAKNLIMDSTTILGEKINRVADSGVDVGDGGNYFGGINRSYTYYNSHAHARNFPYQIAGGQGKVMDTTKLSSGLMNSTLVTTGNGGAGWAGGGGYNSGKHTGGFGSNSSDGARQGSHILIIADKITGFNVASLCTGGDGGRIFSVASPIARFSRTGEQGGCGYGGSGGTISDAYRGGNGSYLGGGGGANSNKGEKNGTNGETVTWASGGGSGAFCFVYCNQVVDANYDGISVD